MFAQLNKQGVSLVTTGHFYFGETGHYCFALTLYLTTSRGVSVPALLSQIDDTTWALFPYTTVDMTFLSASANIIHVAPVRSGSTIRDFAGNVLTSGPAAGGEYTFGFKIM